MATKHEVEAFLSNFRIKSKTIGIIFRDGRQKNSQALLDMEITPMKRREIIDSIVVKDYSEGPNDDMLHGIASLWVFGKQHKGQEIYIKISMGNQDDRTICISFHPSEHPMNYPFNQSL